MENNEEQEGPPELNYYEEFAQRSELLDKVRKSHAHKRSMGKSISDELHVARSTIIASRKSSSVRTVFALANSIVGSIVLLIPGSFL